MTQFLRTLQSVRRFADYRKHRIPNKDILIDISNVCNAQCYYCPIGLANRKGAPSCSQSGAPSFMPTDLFQKILQHLKDTQWLQPHTCLLPYIWHEPLLHPEFASIIRIANHFNCPLDISTNANVLPKIPNDFDASRIYIVWFSMPGFSQQSYDKIHKFDFERIKHNITTLVHTFREHGCIGHFKIAFHVYQSNIHELPTAYEFARSLHIDCQPYFATLCSFKDIARYLKQELSMDFLSKISRDLFMGLTLNLKGPQSTCPWYNNGLAIDSQGNVLPCCNTTDPLGSVFEVTPQKLREWHQGYDFCKECLALGLPNRDNAYCDFYPPHYNWRWQWYLEILKQCLR